TALPIEKDQNEQSVVLHLALSGRSFLLAGDIGFVAERALLSHVLPRQSPAEATSRPLATQSATSSSAPSPTSSLAPVDILKLSHHGSRYSTAPEWLSYWRPAESVASVGRTNSYGHPHPDVASRVREAGSVLRRTDADGEVQ